MLSCNNKQSHIKMTKQSMVREQVEYTKKVAISEIENIRRFMIENKMPRGEVLRLPDGRVFGEEVFLQSYADKVTDNIEMSYVRANSPNVNKFLYSLRKVD